MGKIASSIDQRVLHRSLFAVFPEQVVKGLNGQCIQGGVFFQRQPPQGSPAIRAHARQDLFKGIWVISGCRSSGLWLSSHLIALPLQGDYKITADLAIP